MRLNGKTAAVAFVLLGLGGLLYFLYPYLLFQLTEWQREFNQALSATLRELKNAPHAGISLVFISFLYGVFHAVGPGHGKFVLTGYLSFEQSRLPQAIRITLLSALVQGLVAIAIVTLLVAVLTLSRQYVNLTLKRVEQGSFIVLMLFGLYWLYQAKQAAFPSHKRLKVRKILQISAENRPLAPRFSTSPHTHSADCGCGHKHLPTAAELDRSGDWRTAAMLIFSIGLRPCSGAVLVLFLAYTLDLYGWGVVSALAMAAGTGLTLSLFACLVLFARNKALRLGKWYLSASFNRRLGIGLKFAAGLMILLLGVLLFHSSLLENSPNLLFKR